MKRKAWILWIVWVVVATSLFIVWGASAAELRKPATMKVWIVQDNTATDNTAGPRR